VLTRPETPQWYNEHRHPDGTLEQPPPLKVTEIRTPASRFILAGDCEWAYYQDDLHDARFHDPNRDNVLFLDGHVSYMVCNSDPNLPDTQDWDSLPWHPYYPYETDNINAPPQ
jgi:prepilin-type processing-associated H-X9-DG protein